MANKKKKYVYKLDDSKRIPDLSKKQKPLLDSKKPKKGGK